MNFSSVPVWTIGEKRGTQSKEEFQIPGPGNYGVNDRKNFKSGTKYSFGKSARDKLVADNNNPNIGPGQYNYDSSGFKGIGCAAVKARKNGMEMYIILFIIST